MPLILLIAGDDSNRAMLGRRLEGLGYRLQTANDGQQGLLMAATVFPDLIIMDMHYPDGDAGEIVRQLKSAPDTRAIPVIGLANDHRQLSTAGCDEYADLPVNFAALVAKVKHFLPPPTIP